MENENFEKQLYGLIDNANRDIPSFKAKKKRHFPFKMLLTSLSTVCVVVIFAITINLNNVNSKNASKTMQNEINNVPQGNVPVEESMEASFAGNDECQGSDFQGSGFQDPSFSEQVSSETSSSNSNTTSTTSSSF